MSERDRLLASVIADQRNRALDAAANLTVQLELAARRIEELEAKVNAPAAPPAEPSSAPPDGGAAEPK